MADKHEKTVRVRIEGEVGYDGRYYFEEAFSERPGDEEVSPYCDPPDEGSPRFVIVADIPIPVEPQPTEIKGEVERG